MVYVLLKKVQTNECMPTIKMSTHKRKVSANLEKDACLYFKVKNKLGMFEYWCEIKPKLGERKFCIYLATANGKNIFFFF